MTNLLTANFNDSLPAAPAGQRNVEWQADAPGTYPRNISANVPNIGGVNPQSGTSYTLQASDRGLLVLLTNAAAVTVSADSSLPNDFYCGVLFLGAAGGTVVPTSGSISPTGTFAQNAGAFLFFGGTNWDVLFCAPSSGGSGTVTHTGALTANLPVFGNGTADIVVGTKRGNTTVAQMADSTSNPTTNDLAKFDANGNIVDAGVLASDLATKVGVQNETYSYAADTGAANAYVIALSPTVSSYTAGQLFCFNAAHANSGASTLNAGGGAVAIKKWSSGALVDLALGDIAVGQIIGVRYDGTQFQVTAGIISGGGTSSFPFGGDGSDGAFLLDGTNTYTVISKITSTLYTLNRDVFATTLTINSGVTLQTKWFRVFANASVTVNGTIDNSGGNGGVGSPDASGATGGTGGTGGTVGTNGGPFTTTTLQNPYSATTGCNGSNGKNGGTGAGTNGSQNSLSGPCSPRSNSQIIAATGTPASGAQGGAGGNSGATLGGTGGSVGAGSNGTGVAAWSPPRCPDQALILVQNANSGGGVSLPYSSTGSVGQNTCGGSGAGDGTNSGGGSGAGGACGGGGGAVVVSSPTITVGASGSILAKGGNGARGGNGGNATAGNAAGGGGGAGGCGGQGGIISLVYHSLANSGTISVAGGSGGALGTGGSGHGTGGNGSNGNTGPNGQTGALIQIQI